MATDHDRVRRILKIASKKTKNKALRAWLFDDERGKHAERVAWLLDRTSERAGQLGMTVAQVDDEIAIMIYLGAAQAMLEHGKKGR